DFRKWADGLFPPKLLVAGTTFGRLDPAWLDLTASDERLPLYPEAHEHHHHEPASVEPLGRRAEHVGLTPRRSPLRYPSPPGVRPACCGWVFSPADMFDEGKLLALLAGTKGITRLKGVFHLEDEWATVNRAGTAVSVAPTAYRRDSRLEVFSDTLDWAAFESDLMGCLLTPEARP